MPKRTTEEQHRKEREQAARARARKRGEDVPYLIRSRLPDDQLTPRQLKRRRWRDQNPEKVREYTARYRAKQREKLNLAISNKDKTHCPAGHGYTEDTTYIFQGSRRCRLCHNDQVKADYAADPEPARIRSRASYANGYGAEYNQRRKEQRAADPETARMADRERYQRDGINIKERIKLRRHGLTKDEWDIMFNSQGGCCYLCGRELGDDPVRIHLDHDHRHPHVSNRSCKLCHRGIACRTCNNIAGIMRDNVALLRKIADNLEKAMTVVTENLREEGKNAGPE